MVSGSIVISGQRFRPIGPESKYRHDPIANSTLHTMHTLRRHSLTEGIVLKVSTGKFRAVGGTRRAGMPRTIIGSEKVSVDSEERYNFEVPQDTTILMGRMAGLLDQSPTGKVSLIEGKETIQKAIVRLIERYRERILKMERKGVHERDIAFFAETVVKDVKCRLLGIVDTVRGWTMLPSSDSLNQSDRLAHAVCFSAEYKSIPRLAASLSFFARRDGDGFAFTTDGYSFNGFIEAYDDNWSPFFLLGTLPDKEGLVQFGSPVDYLGC